MGHNIICSDCCEPVDEGMWVEGDFFIKKFICYACYEKSKVSV